MNCTEARMQLDAWIDGQLDATSAERVAEHVSACTECAAAVERRRALGDLLRREMLPLKAPDALRQRVRSAVSASSAATRRHTRISVGTIAAVAASLLIVMGGTWQVATRERAEERVSDEVLAAHVRSLIGTHLTDVVSSDQHTVKPWFNGKIDYSPTVADFAAQGYPLLGGRLEYIDGRRVAALVYARRQHMINVFVWPSADGVTSSGSITRQGYHLIHWTADGYIWWVASDLEGAEVEEFARLQGAPR